MIHNNIPLAAFFAILTSAAVPLQATTTDYKLTGPYSKDNLSIFLIHGDEQTKNKSYLTLSEAMQQKKVRVYETGKVQELTIENLSQNEDIYIQSGDIVKGGRQDRVFSTDMLLQAKSGKVPIASFCVESNRWAKRGKENVATFSSSSSRLISKKQKLATKLHKDQAQVWDEVAKSQEKISKALNEQVKDTRSSSSLQLTLENKTLRKNILQFEQAFDSLLDGKDDVIGYVYAINGELNSADIYASKALFRKVWPKLLRATTAEAVTERGKKSKPGPLNKKAVATWFAKADRAKAKRDIVSASTTVITQNGAENVRFDTIDTRDKAVIHRNYLSK